MIAQLVRIGVVLTLLCVAVAPVVAQQALPGAPASPPRPNPQASAKTPAPLRQRVPQPVPDIDFAALGSEAGAATPVESEAQRKWREDYVQRGWEWHLFSTKLLFWLVIAIVAFGLYITYVQFRRDYSAWQDSHHPQPAGGEADKTQPAQEPAPPAPSSLKLGPGGLEITSQVVGLLVLALSLGFFYLYIRDVYPIQIADSVRATSSSADGAANSGKRDGTR